MKTGNALANMVLVEADAIDAWMGTSDSASRDACKFISINSMLLQDSILPIVFQIFYFIQSM